LVSEVVSLAKKYGITTPYTSYLIVPDAAVPVAGPGRKLPAAAPGGGVPDVRFHLGGYGFNGGTGGATAAGLAPKQTGAAPQKVVDYARSVNAAPGMIAQNRLQFEADKLKNLPADAKGGKDGWKALGEAKSKLDTYQLAEGALRAKRQLE